MTDCENQCAFCYWSMSCCDHITDRPCEHMMPYYLDETDLESDAEEYDVKWFNNYWEKLGYEVFGSIEEMQAYFDGE